MVKQVEISRLDKNGLIVELDNGVEVNIYFNQDKIHLHCSKILLSPLNSLKSAFFISFLLLI